MDVPQFTDRTRASLKIQEGCNNFCTFCIIPWARGLMRSRPPEEVVKQAQQLVDAGYKEIVLTGIHTGGYGEDLKDYNLAQLLRDLESQVVGLKRIRISSIEASQISDEVIEVLDQSEKVVRHLHIPLQSGSDTVLKRMRRKYTMEFYMSRVKKVKEALPGLAITSDVIVGFPGETEEEFMETYRSIQEIGFSELHVFPYSQRTGTPAARMKDQIDDEIKHERVRQLIELSNQQAKEYASQYEDEVLEVIPEEKYKRDPESGLYEGYTDNYLKVVFPATEDMVGKIVRVKVKKAGYPYNEAEFVRVMDDAPIKRQLINKECMNMTKTNLASMIDHTQLKPETQAEKINQICKEAKENSFASVCVNPTWVSHCHELLKESDVKVCTVIGFPLGATTSETKAFETKQAIENGATEVDMVINIGSLKDNRYEEVERDIQAVVDAAKDQALVKVIIETSLLTKEEKVKACELAKKAGADFVKTSTGFSGGGATVEDVRLMRLTVGPEMGVKASGGVRSLEDANAMIDAGATRIGASSGVEIVKGETSNSDY